MGDVVLHKELGWMMDKFKRLRAKFVNADGGFQYKILDKVYPIYHVAIMPRLTPNWIKEVDPSIAIKTHKRSFEYYGRNENGILEYREIVE